MGLSACQLVSNSVSLDGVCRCSAEMMTSWGQGHYDAINLEVLLL
jgi:hypothetical protein